MKTTAEYATEILQELQRTVKLISGEGSDSLVDAIGEARHIFLAGAGRSGLMAKAFAMRLMHLGLNVHVVGETVTPGLGKEDLLIICSGSGETKSLVSMAEKAKSLEAAVALITIYPNSTIGQLSRIAITLPGAPKDKSTSDYSTIQPMGSLFEQTLLLFLDAVILSLMEKQGLDSSTMYGSHANLE
ncbi:6-phospho-3-hexuloisomerase [Paenibacillus agricola]|uniref:6-phospho-3-hexuloisomerase n=1 Tax=Paenibacillus agricola TaxID=2716264 RepID=A0ABX0JFN7_9BACL|nr:6-phospho-3-hexuloisomerase [Paenibacillus agricola]NHN35360.1 6-phospho-3-hexuloisomerase [Paenibacillus agricola]